MGATLYPGPCPDPPTPTFPPEPAMSASPGRGRSLIAQGAFVALLAVAWWLDHKGEPAAPADRVEGLSLQEVAGELGIDFTHQAPDLDPRLDPIAPQIAALGAAVSVADADGDGRPDIYLTTSRFGEGNALYLNQGDGRFEDVAAAAGAADLNRPGVGVSIGSVWADVDNDGDEDLFVYRWGDQALLRNDGPDAEGVPRFTDISADSGLDRWMNAVAAVWFDADQDGLVDLYVAGYYHQDHDLWDLETTRIMHDDFEFATNGGDNFFFQNLGDGRFEERTEAVGLSSQRWTMGLGAADFDDDGWIDLYTANDYGAEEFFRNRGDGTFELVDAGMGDDSKSGMCVALGEVQNEARLAVYVTNISERGYLFQGNNLRLNYLAESGVFDNVAQDLVANCGWAWGSQFGDFDNDGWQDLFVANGFISGDTDNSYWYDQSKISVATSAIVEDAAAWPEMGDADLSGYQRSRLLLNLNGRVFRDVAEQVGVADTYDGRAVALADLDGRGALDILVANQKQPFLVYRCEPEPGRHWVQFELEGTHSNRSCIGASVTVRGGHVNTLRVVDGGSGFCSQNGRRLHFGLGEVDRLEEVVVRWPDGRKQTLSDLGVDQVHHLVEPSP